MSNNEIRVNIHNYDYEDEFDDEETFNNQLMVYMMERAYGAPRSRYLLTPINSIYNHSPVLRWVRSYEPHHHSTSLQFGLESVLHRLFEEANKELKEDPSIQIKYETVIKNEEHKTCSICFDELEEKGAMLECKHTFHPQCIEKWGRIKQECPVCRHTIPKK